MSTHPAVDVLGERAVAVQDRVDREVVVVPGDQVERDGAVAQPLVGQVASTAPTRSFISSWSSSSRASGSVASRSASSAVEMNE